MIGLVTDGFYWVDGGDSAGCFYEAGDWVLAWLKADVDMNRTC